MKANQEIRKLMEANKLKYWEVANKIGVSPSTLTVWLRTEIDEQKKSQLLRVIKSMKKKEDEK